MEDAIHQMPEGLFRQEDYITHVMRHSITSQAFCLRGPFWDNEVRARSAELHRGGKTVSELDESPDPGDKALLGLRQHVLQRMAALMEKRLDLSADINSPLRF